jgi:hypothetical protein
MSSKTNRLRSNPKIKMSAQKKSSGHGSTPKGDCEPGLTPLIPFVPPKVDEGDEPPMVDITIKKNTKNHQPRSILRPRLSGLLKHSHETELSL